MRRTAIYLSGYGLFALASIVVISGAALLYTPQEVGDLSIVIAFQFLLSQFAGSGIHFSALYHDSRADKVPVSPMYALLTVVFTSVLWSLFFSLCYPLMVSAFYSPELLVYGPHLVVYAVMVASNKVFAAQLNAKEQYSALGMLFAFKGVLSLVMIGLCMYMQWPLSLYVTTVVLLPEILAFIIYVGYALRHIHGFSWGNVLLYFTRDFKFGMKALWGAIFLDSNTKVDVLMLGAFTDAKTTGIYTFIALASDLFLQFTTLLRSWVNPKVTKVYMESDVAGFRRFLKVQLQRSYVLGILFMLVVCGGFAGLIHAVPEYEQYQAGLPALYVISAFLCLCAGFFPLLQVFGQIGRPMTQSYIFAALFVTNVALNIVFIPWLGMIGAAFGTGLAYVVFAALLWRSFGNLVSAS
jgi:O-antigen/teichoic acid export membrane protein